MASAGWAAPHPCSVYAGCTTEGPPAPWPPTGLPAGPAPAAATVPPLAAGRSSDAAPSSALRRVRAARREHSGEAPGRYYLQSGPKPQDKEFYPLPSSFQSILPDAPGRYPDHLQLPGSQWRRRPARPAPRPPPGLTAPASRASGRVSPVCRSCRRQALRQDSDVSVTTRAGVQPAAGVTRANLRSRRRRLVEDSLIDDATPGNSPLLKELEAGYAISGQRGADGRLRARAAVCCWAW